MCLLASKCKISTSVHGIPFIIFILMEHKATHFWPILCFLWLGSFMWHSTLFMSNKDTNINVGLSNARFWKRNVHFIFKSCSGFIKTYLSFFFISFSSNLPIFQEPFADLFFLDRPPNNQFWLDQGIFCINKLSSPFFLIHWWLGWRFVPYVKLELWPCYFIIAYCVLAIVLQLVVLHFFKYFVLGHNG